MILPNQNLIRAAELAKELGVARSTIWKWCHDDERIKACRFRRDYFSVQRLREAGILVTPTPIGAAQ